MAASRVSSPPGSLKERIAALQERTTSPPPVSGGMSPLASPLGMGAGPPRSTSPPVPANPGSLRDKIAKFERKGGTPVPRGSFGIGVPPVVEPGASKKKGELYGNRVPGLGRPHNVPSAGRSATGLVGGAQGSAGEAERGRRAVSTPLTGFNTGASNGSPSPRPLSPDDEAAEEYFSSSDGPDTAPAAPSTPAPLDTPTILVSPDPAAGSAPHPPLPSSYSLDISREEFAASTATSPSASPHAPATPVQPPSPQTTTDGALPPSSNVIPGVITLPSGMGEQSASNASAEIGPNGSTESLPPPRPERSPSRTRVITGPPRKVSRSKIPVPFPSDLKPSAEAAPRETAVQKPPLDLSARPSVPDGDQSFGDSSMDVSNISIDTNDIEIVRGSAVHYSPSTSRPVLVPAPKQASPPAAAPAVASPPSVIAEKEPPQPKFTAVVHRRTTVQHTAPRPPSSHERDYYATPTKIPTVKVPVKTVKVPSTPGPTDELAMLLSSASLLEEQLLVGGFPSPSKEWFPSTLDSPITLQAPKTPRVITSKASTPNPYSRPKKEVTDSTEASHGRTQSVLTLKPTKDDEPVEEPLASPLDLMAPLTGLSQELVMPFMLGEREVPPTPPPKSPRPRYFSNIRKSSSTLRNTVSMVLPGTNPRHSMAASSTSEMSSEDSMPVATPPSPNEFDAVMVTPPRHSRSMTFRDDASRFSGHSHESSGSSWSLKRSPKKAKSVGRTTSFAEKIWSKSRSRTTSTTSRMTIDTVDEVPNGARSPSPSPSLAPLPFEGLSTPVHVRTLPSSGGTRPVSWLSTSSMNSPAIDGRIFDEFPSVPSNDPRSKSATRLGPLSPPLPGLSEEGVLTGSGRTASFGRPHTRR